MHIEHIWPRFQLEELFNGDLLHVRHDMRVEIKGGADLGVEYELAKSSSIMVQIRMHCCCDAFVCSHVSVVGTLSIEGHLLMCRLHTASSVQQVLSQLFWKKER